MGIDDSFFEEGATSGGQVFCVNFNRSLVGYETDNGYDYCEIMSWADGIEIDDIIIGELDNTQVQTIEITNQRTGNRINVCIEDFGQTFSSAIEAIS